jgi:8-oxo-dGTP pyrophosphatase MutT (NUDIX family)
MPRVSERGEDGFDREENSPQAAVALIVRGDTELEALLIKRADSERDSWSGHMVLLGGRRDDADETFLATAIRETMEEVGLDLDRQARLLGYFDSVAPPSWRLSPLMVRPFLFSVTNEAQAYVASPEVADVFWVPVRELNSPAGRSTVEIPFTAWPAKSCGASPTACSNNSWRSTRSRNWT